MKALKTLRKTVLTGSLMTLAAVTVGCGLRAQTPLGSALDTVSINQTPVKDQQGVGFCWSYAMSGMLESEAFRDGVALDLSEEYLGFYHMFITTYYALKNKDPDMVSEGTGLDEPIELVAAMGIVPESVFSHKFAEAGLEKALIARVKVILADEAKTAELLADEDALFQEIGAVFGARPPMPDESFAFEGKSYTPVSFAKERLGFNKDNYTVVSLSLNRFDEAIEYVKTSLMNGYTVPIGIPVYAKTPQSGAFDLGQCKSTGCKSEGGHAMLVVDFATQGGRFGDMSAVDARAVYDKPLTGLMVKNSWGLDNGLTQDATKPADKLSGGFYTITREYLTPDAKDIVVPTFAPMVLLRVDEMHKTTPAN
jgi:hypothetical protein